MSVDCNFTKFYLYCKSVVPNCLIIVVLLIQSVNYIVISETLLNDDTDKDSSYSRKMGNNLIEEL